MRTECLIDSGSPISFMKKSIIPIEVRERVCNEKSFCGINGSRLRILGEINANVSLEGQTTGVCIYVVGEETMRPSLVLGRDFLKTAGYVLQRATSVDDILNIDIGTESPLSVEANINEDLPSELRVV